MSRVGRYEVMGRGFVLTAARPWPAVLRPLLSGLAPNDRVEPAAPGDDSRIAIRRVGWRRWSVVVDGSVDAGGVDAADTLAQLLISVNRLAAESAAPRHLVLHAGAVARPGGGVVVVAGESGAGKTTLVAAATRAGWGYVADEVTVIDDGGHVRPYRRPLGLRPDGARSLGLAVPAHHRYRHVAPLLPAGAEGGTGRVEAIVLPERNGAPAAMVATLSPAEALVALSRCGIGAGGYEAAMFRRFEHAARTVPVLRLEYRDARDAVELLESTPAAE